MPSPAGLARPSLPLDEALVLLETDAAHGLDAEEAALRLRRHGPNVMPRVERRGALVRVVAQFRHPLIYVLLGAAAITYALGEYVDASVVLGVVIANAVVGFVQEARAEQALDALNAMITVEARVLRDGGELTVPASELVPGDVVLLRPGDKVSADLRLLTADELAVDESSLTGESVPVRKLPGVLAEETLLADRANLAFSGTLITAGRGTGVVVRTGGDTELGLIHRLLGETAELTTPLTRKLARFSRTLTIVILVLAALAFALGTARGESASDMLVAAVALAVGAIPEGLPAAVTIALAIGVSRMARRNAVVRALPAVETLGSTTVICTDKTGTLTQNEMTVRAVVAGGRTYELHDREALPVGEDPALALCLLAGMVCGDADVVEHDGERVLVGDPTETALVAAARNAGLDRASELERHPRLDVVPFESERRYMAVTLAGEDGPVMYVKGALESVLAMCSVTAGEAGAAHAAADALGHQGHRVLAFAAGEPGRRLAFLGLQAMSDPPRPEAVAAVRACREAGIAVKMITGDHAATARAIAHQVGLGAVGAEASVVTGADLAGIPEADLPALVESTDVFARVSAEQKLRLVRALQGRGEVVAMTGDGVNDAPALRQADIGVAMGRNGTEVAREAADIVLTDDNFASIRAAVEEGRHTYDNLKKFIAWTLPTNLAEGLLILTAIVVGATLPILPVQILWINMTTAVLLGLTLAFERAEAGLMSRPPRDPSEPLLTRDVVWRILLVSVLTLVASFWLFESLVDSGHPTAEARTAAINVFVAVEIAYLLNCRSLTGSARSLGLLSNRWLIGGIALTVALQLLLTYASPMQDLFSTAAIDLETWAEVGLAGLVAWLVVEVEKAVRRRRA